MQPLVVQPLAERQALAEALQRAAHQHQLALRLPRVRRPQSPVRLAADSTAGTSAPNRLYPRLYG